MWLSYHPYLTCKKDKRRTSPEFLEKWSKSLEKRDLHWVLLWNLPFISLQFEKLQIKMLGWVVTREGRGAV